MDIRSAAENLPATTGELVRTFESLNASLMSMLVLLIDKGVITREEYRDNRLRVMAVQEHITAKSFDEEVKKSLAKMPPELRELIEKAFGEGSSE